MLILAAIFFIILLVILAYLVLILISFGLPGFILAIILITIIATKAKAIFLLIYLGLERIKKPSEYHKMEGKIGIAYTDIDEKDGWAQINGELWQARSIYGKIPKGSQIIVVRKEDSIVFVEKYTRGFEVFESKKRKIEF